MAAANSNTQACSSDEILFQNEKGLRLGGITPFTTIDYPDHLAAVLYCRGCPLRCSYCHNADMQSTLPSLDDPDWEETFNFLKRRVGMLEAVVFSGGEPLVQKNIFQAMRDVKALGYKIGVHTAGTGLSRMKEALSIADWVGFDVKHHFEDYEIATCVPNTGEKSKKCLEALIESGVDYEVRTTIDPEIIKDDKLIELAVRLKEMGVKKYCLQESSVRKSNYKAETYQEIEKLFQAFELRRATMP